MQQWKNSHCNQTNNQIEIQAKMEKNVQYIYFLILKNLFAKRPPPCRGEWPYFNTVSHLMVSSMNIKESRDIFNYFNYPFNE